MVTTREYYRKWKTKYPWKPHGEAAKLRCRQVNNRKYKTYGARGIKYLLTSEQLKELWFRDKAYLLDRPSIDRKDNDNHYSFENCRFIELSINSSNGASKPVLQISSNGKTIKKWDSQVKAAMFFGVSETAICQAIRKGYFSCGYKWKPA